MQKVTTFLWFDNNGEEAMKLYTDLFPDGKIISAQKIPDGSMMMGEFEIMGTRFSVLNGGPHDCNFNEAISLFVSCEDQAEVDKYWEALIADGGEESRCGWLKDKFGLSWQIIPKQLSQLMSDPDRQRANRAMQAMMKMNKIIVADLQSAADGK